MRDWHAFVRARLDLSALTPARQARLQREIAAQLEDVCRDALAGGASPAAAEALAERQISDWPALARDLAAVDPRHARTHVDRVVEALEARGAGRRGAWGVLTDAIHDVRHALRQLTRTPGFTLVAVLTLGLGIGATSAIFSVINGVVFRPLPYPDPDRLVRLFETTPRFGPLSVAPATFLDWRQQTTAFTALGAYTGDSVTLAADAGPDRIQGAGVTADVFAVLGVQPLLGRAFLPADDQPGAPRALILSHGTWQHRFNADPAIVGRGLMLNGEPATVVGVMPEGFSFPSRDAEFWRPLRIDTARPSRGSHYLSVVARLKPGVDLARAQAELAGITERLAAQFPDTSGNESAEADPLAAQIVGKVRPLLFMLLAAVTFVVLIACANVANLLLARASTRAKEIAIRAAVGAGRRRLVLQLLTESLVLALAGGAVGLLLAGIAIAPLQRLAADTIPRVQDITMDLRVLTFAAGVSLLTGLLFGLAPAWQSSRADLQRVLREGGRSSSTHHGQRLRNGLLVAQIALAMVLLVGAALLLHSFYRLSTVHPGFDAERALAFRVALPQPTYPEEYQRRAFFEALVARLERVPGIRSAGLVQTIPLGGGYALSFSLPGQPPPTPGDGPAAGYRSVSPRYFETLGIPVLEGRTFSPRDTVTAAKVAIVDRAFVHRYFPDGHPLGRQILIGNGSGASYEIVGVAGDVRYEELDARPDPTMYVPFAQAPFASMWVVARTDADPAAFSAAARQAVREIDGTVAAFSMGPLSELVSDAVATRRFVLLLLGLFALSALFLAAVGLYGVVAYSVSQRTQEIGVRMAMGAERRHVRRLIVGGAMKLALAGIAAGLAGALALSRLLGSMLYEVTPFDPLSYAVTAAALLAVAALACHVPARRAMRVDPVVALRQA